MAAAIGTPAGAETTWRASIFGPQRASTQPFEWFAREVTAKTGGQLRFDITYGQAKPTEAIDLLKSGSAEVAYLCVQYHGDQIPLATVIDLPMLAPDNLVALDRVALALGEHPPVQAELKKWNVRMLLPVPLPQYQLMGTRRVARIDDLQGARVRISAEMGKVLEEYGATISVIPSTESAAALKSGALDLVALPYPYAFATFRVHEAARYVTDRISLGAPLCFLGVGQKAWEALPVKVQDVVLGLRQPAVARYEHAYVHDDAAQIALFRAKGIEFVPFSVADRARLVAKAVKVWQAWVEEREKQGLKGREVFEFTQTKIREFTRR
jgi:TRAP-type C4-dicarboxylate transport system substrate-binding protein